MTTLLAASTGGHLAELVALTPRFDLASDPLWFTFDTPQARSLLAGRDVVYAPPSTSRDVLGTLKDAECFRGVMRSHEIDRVVSTGASIAVGVMPLAARRGIPCHYVESATRVDGPSLSGKLLARVDGVSLYTQHEHWAGGKWMFGGSVFDDFTSLGVPMSAPVTWIVVSLGTHPKFGFRRLVEQLVRLIPRDVEVLWQVGATDVTGLGIDGRVAVPTHELRAAIEQADTVVTHAGVGSALMAFDLGHRPVFVPRRADHAEHVDDHQHFLGDSLMRRGLVDYIDADALSVEHIARPHHDLVARRAVPLPFDLRSAESARQLVRS